ncbi:MAG: glycine zipper 2TM domain-containing protein [Rhodospirillales bacterium]|nr:glycine zipper 2TM domain-containing protein [Rhodospirillales bacterium]
MNLQKTALPVILVLSLAACQQGEFNKQTGGTIIGAGLGALVGSQIGSGGGQLAAVAVGTLAGAFLGSEVGKSLDRADRLAMQQTSHSALESAPTHQVSSWRNPDSGHSGTVTPTRTYNTPSGHNCREYTQTVTIDGRTETVRGTACRQYDGTWKVANN